MSIFLGEKDKATLASIYDNIAQRFSDTRKKHRPEFDSILGYITDYIKKSGKKTIHIVELGCGDGRFWRFCSEKIPKSLCHISYSGIDFSENFIDIAQSYKNTSGHDQQFIVQDMVAYMQNVKPHSIDIIVSIASIQHIHTLPERILLMQSMYRSLVRQGKNITCNRYLSQRFRTKYYKELFYARCKYICTLGYRDPYNVYIPFTDPTTQKVYNRFYHLFTHKEIKRLSYTTGFIIDQITPENNNNQSDTRTRNMIVMRRKDVSL